MMSRWLSLPIRLCRLGSIHPTKKNIKKLILKKIFDDHKKTFIYEMHIYLGSHEIASNSDQLDILDFYIYPRKSQVPVKNVNCKI